MVDQPRLLLTDGSEVGATQGGSVCVGAEPPPSTLHVMEALQESNSVGHITAALEEPRARLLLPSIEPDPGSVAENQAGESGDDGHYSILAISTLVPDDSGHVNQSSSTDSEGDGAFSTRKRTGHFTEKSDVVAHCMEQLFRSSMRMPQTRIITDFKALDLDLKPAIRYLEALPGNALLSLQQLTSKLCWLLAVVGMFRGEDIACIDIAHVTV
ncbi:hypothetical protein BGZ72_000708 [Mortierella alpina]|nr:hypothetical protein BGZ72_000708 [Mortierella alpina]